MPKKKTFAEHLEAFREVHGDRYLYEEQDLPKGNATPIKIVCKLHGEFTQLVGNHRAGHNCPDCGYLSRSLTSRNTKEEFMRRAKEVHGDRYSYSSVEYKNCSLKVSITCKVHGEFLQTPNAHLCGKGCPACNSRDRLTRDTFLARSASVHGDKYDYTNSIVTNSDTKVEILCTSHGPFYQKPHKHFSGRGCPSCWEDRAGWRLNEEQLLEDYCLYLIEIRNVESNNTFYKVGITKYDLEYRFKYLKLDGFEYTTISIYRGLGKDCQKLEDDVLGMLKEMGEYRCVDDLKGTRTSGWTECFKQKPNLLRGVCNLINKGLNETN